MKVQSPRRKGEKTHLIRAATTMGAMTLVSRILGMARDIVSANAFGTSWQWDAFLYAFMIPNFLRRIVGEGAFSSSFIPVYNEVLHKEGQEAAFHFVNVTVTVLMTLLTLLILFAELVLTGLLQGHFLSPTLRLTCDLLRYLFPYLWFVSIWALSMGVLNSHRHFFTSALGPIILNLAWIMGILVILPRTDRGINHELVILAIVICVGGMVQLALELPPLYRLGFRPRWIFDFAAPGLKKMGQLVLPSLLTFAIFQVNITIDMTLGLWIGPGANSSLWYGTRLMQLPLGVFAVAAGSAILPAAARQGAAANLEETSSIISFALRGIFLIVLPCAVGLMVLSRPIVQLLFERGHFDAESTRRTAAVLWCYSLGLFAYSGQKILNNGFYAVQDTRTPMQLGAFSLICNIVLNLLLIKPLAEAGLALSTSISGILQFALLIFLYHRRVVALDLRGTTWSFLKIFLASLAMGAVGALVFQRFQQAIPAKGMMPCLLRVSSAILIAAASYPFFCFLFGVREMTGIVRKGIARIFPGINLR